MALEGSLRDFGLADILQLIYFQKKTGVLTLSSERDRVRLAFYEGNVISAESRRRVEENRIGKILLKKGLVKEDELKSSLEEQKATGVRLGDILLKRGLVKNGDVVETLIAQMTETVTQLFSWKDGTYEFQAQPVAPSKDMPISLDTQHLLMDGLRVLDEWSLVEGKITLDTVFSKTLQTESDLNVVEEKILRFVDGENDVSIIIGLSGVDDFEASKVLVSLMERGIISPMTAAAVMAETPAPVRREKVFAGALYSVLFFLVLIISLGTVTLRETWSKNGLVTLLAGDALKKVRTEKQIDKLRLMAEAYKFRSGSYPARLEQIGDARDAWGRPYYYGIENGFLIILSPGPDGKIGTADDIY